MAELDVGENPVATIVAGTVAAASLVALSIGGRAKLAQTPYRGQFRFQAGDVNQLQPESSGRFIRGARKRALPLFTNKRNATIHDVQADIFKVDRMVFKATQEMEKQRELPISKRRKQRSYTVPIFTEPDIIAAARRLGAYIDPRNAPVGFVHITTDYKIEGISKYPKKSDKWMKLGGPGRYETVEFKWIKKGQREGRRSSKGFSEVQVRGSTTEYPSATGGMGVEVYFNEKFFFDKPADQVSNEEIIDELEQIDFMELLEDQYPEIYPEILEGDLYARGKDVSIHKGREVTNLRQMNRSFGQEIIDWIKISRPRSGGGFIEVKWGDGTKSSSDFADFSVLLDWLDSKRTIRGEEIRFGKKRIPAGQLQATIGRKVAFRKSGNNQQTPKQQAESLMMKMTEAGVPTFRRIGGIPFATATIPFSGHSKEKLQAEAKKYRAAGVRARVQKLAGKWEVWVSVEDAINFKIRTGNNPWAGI